VPCFEMPGCLVLRCLDEMPCFEMPGRAAAKGLQPRAAARHMVTTKPGRFFPCFSNFSELAGASGPKLMQLSQVGLARLAAASNIG